MIIGIGGPSRAGKTTLAKKLGERLEKKGRSVLILSQEDFIKPQIALPKIQGQLAWERPSSVNWDKLTKKVEKSEAEFTIVEGTFVFYPADLRAEFHRKIYLDIDKKTFEGRKDEDNRWEDAEPEWYPEHMIRSNMKYGEKKGADKEYITLDGSQKVDLDMLFDALEIKALK